MQKNLWQYSFVIISCIGFTIYASDIDIDNKKKLDNFHKELQGCVKLQSKNSPSNFERLISSPHYRLSQDQVDDLVALVVRHQVNKRGIKIILALQQNGYSFDQTKIAITERALFPLTVATSIASQTKNPVKKREALEFINFFAGTAQGYLTIKLGEDGLSTNSIPVMPIEYWHKKAFEKFKSKNSKEFINQAMESILQSTIPFQDEQFDIEIRIYGQLLYLNEENSDSTIISSTYKNGPSSLTKKKEFLRMRKERGNQSYKNLSKAEQAKLHHDGKQFCICKHCNLPFK